MQNVKIQITCNGDESIETRNFYADEVGNTLYISEVVRPDMMPVIAELPFVGHPNYNLYTVLLEYFAYEYELIEISIKNE